MSMPYPERCLIRPEKRAWRHRSKVADARAFHAGWPGYGPTPLVGAPTLASELGVGQVFVKDESSRFGLPAFKILGVSWAVYRAVSQRVEGETEPTPTGIRRSVDRLLPLELVTATGGNHGRALARMARTIGCASHIFVAASLPARVVAAIRDEGAVVTMIDGSYDDAVHLAAEYATFASDRLLIQDTALPGFEAVPTWTVEGYSTLFHETDSQIREAGVAAPDLVAVPTGVGSLLQAALVHYRRAALDHAPVVMSTEPDAASCVLASVRRGRLASIPTGETVMAALRCGEPSFLAWPAIDNGLDAAVAVSDDETRQAMGDLHRIGVPAGPSGASSLAGVRATLAGPEQRAALGIDSRSVLLLISTEGIASGAA